MRKRFLVLAALLAAPLFGDVVETKNGARIVGKIVRIEDGAIAVETDYAGTLATRGGGFPPFRVFNAYLGSSAALDFASAGRVTAP